MNVLSLFDGISCGRLALERAGIKVNKYYASEISKTAIEISKRNFPDIIQLGDVTKISSEILDTLEPIDIILAGSPCQDLSNYKYDRGEVTGLNGEKSGLFYDFVRILKYIKPKYFLLENVASMERKWCDMISNILEVEPIMINSALVCGAERKRYYWTNIRGVTQPEDKKIFLKDIVEPAENVPLKYWYGDKYPITIHEGDVKVKATLNLNGHRSLKEVYNINFKCNTLSADGGGVIGRKKLYKTAG